MKIKLPSLENPRILLASLVFFLSLITGWHNVTAKQASLDINVKKTSTTVDLLKKEIGLINQTLATIQADVKHTMGATTRIENLILADKF